MTADDVLAARKFDDCIARGSYMIDIHDPNGGGTVMKKLAPGESYDIPYRCLVPKSIDNLLIAGRPISTTHEAHSSIRIMPIAAAIGEAAGTAAALCVRGKTIPCKLDSAELQRVLIAQGANLEHIQPEDKPSSGSKIVVTNSTGGCALSRYVALPIVLMLLAGATFAADPLYDLTDGQTKQGQCALGREPGEHDVRRGINKVVIADLKGPGVITMVHFALPAKMTITRDVVLRIWWDGEKTPSVEAPLCDFFCDPNGTLERVDSAFVNKKRGWKLLLPDAVCQVRAGRGVDR